jgi:hypothetical protein
MSAENAFPLQWPLGWKRTPRHMKKWGRFEGTLDRCRRELLREIDMLALGAASRTHRMTSTVISSNMPLRKDGEMNASAARPDDTGVAVYFHRGEQRLAMACDQYMDVWENLRALQKTIEAMRGIERWGSSSLLDRAFTGFAALPAPRGGSCWDLLGIGDQWESATEEQVKDAWRARVKVVHPSVPGGSEDALREVNEAKDLALSSVANRRAKV